ncbi:MAG: hypothetical protein ACP6IP_06430 [Candidatus Njordarchaeia archaeon]
MSDVVVIRIPNELKKEMKKIKINWSEYLREKIRERIRKEKLKQIWDEIEELKKLIPPSPTKDFSTRSIREDRER